MAELPIEVTHQQDDTTKTPIWDVIAIAEMLGCCLVATPIIELHKLAERIKQQTPEEILLLLVATMLQVEVRLPPAAIIPTLETPQRLVAQQLATEEQLHKVPLETLEYVKQQLSKTTPLVVSHRKHLETKQCKQHVPQRKQQHLQEVQLRKSIALQIKQLVQPLRQEPKFNREIITSPM
jgi:hypothetical protein